MEIENQSINALIEHWDWNARFDVKSKQEIQIFLSHRQITLPEDFISLYSFVNGMTDEDEECFRFYALSELISIGEKFEVNSTNGLNEIVLFCEYMMQSWWYGIKLKDDGSYVIGIVPTKDKFTPVTESLNEFIKLYLNDSEILYKY